MIFLTVQDNSMVVWSIFSLLTCVSVCHPLIVVKQMSLANERNLNATDLRSDAVNSREPSHFTKQKLPRHHGSALFCKITWKFHAGGIHSRLYVFSRAYASVKVDERSLKNSTFDRTFSRFFYKNRWYRFTWPGASR